MQHAAGYEQFVRLASDYGTSARDLFDLWRFAHFIRAHAAAFAVSPGLQHSAVVFLGNALIADHHDLVWQHHEHGLVAETIEPPMLWVGEQAADNPRHRMAPVERIVEALLRADEQRFHEFHPTVAQWQHQRDQ